MPQIIHCVRHAQGYHNLTSANHAMRDPMLTGYGETQCRGLQASFPHHDGVELIVASPLRRTLQTALLSFEETIAAKGLSVVALPELQETSDLPCDTGSDPYDLAKAFGLLPVDINLVQPGWESKGGKFAPTPRAISERAAEVRRWLANRPEREIVVVTHGAFLHYLTEDWSDYSRADGTGWANTEFRSYRFDSQAPNETHLVETKTSRQRREKLVGSLIQDVQHNLEQAAPAEVKKGGKTHPHRAALSRELHHIKAKLTGHHHHHGSDVGNSGLSAQ